MGFCTSPVPAPSKIPGAATASVCDCAAPPGIVQCSAFPAVRSQQPWCRQSFECLPLPFCEPALSQTWFPYLQGPGLRWRNCRHGRRGGESPALLLFPHPAALCTLKRISFTVVFQKIEVTGLFPSGALHPAAPPASPRPRGSVTPLSADALARSACEGPVCSGLLI